MGSLKETQLKPVEQLGSVDISTEPYKSGDNIMVPNIRARS